MSEEPDERSREAERILVNFYEYSAEITGGILCATTSYAMRRANFTQFPFVFSGFTIMLAHGVTNIIVNIFPDPDDSCLHKFNNCFAMMTASTPIALLNMELCLSYKIDKIIAFTPVFASMFQILMKTIDSPHSGHFLDVLMIGNIASITVFSMLMNNVWLSHLSMFYALNHLLLYNLKEKKRSVDVGEKYRNINKRNVKNIALSLISIVTLFSLKCCC